MKNKIIQDIEKSSPEELAQFIFTGKITSEDLKSTGLYSLALRKRVDEILQQLQEEEKRLEAEANKAARERSVFEDLINNPNKWNPKKIRESLSPEYLQKLANAWDLDLKLINEWEENELDISDNFPKSIDDIPQGYTDVFFWGIPSSGKSCALSALFFVLQKKFAITDADGKAEMGRSYRKSLTRSYDKKSGVGYLPERTLIETTQYMPYKFKKIDSNYYRKASFFELSGELFKHIHDIVNKSKIDPNISKVFNSVNLVLKSDNPKIHFFFIDYSRDSFRKKINSRELNQEDYLESAATFFKENSDIFSSKTKKIYIVVTKSDYIEEKNRNQGVKDFLDENFSNFILNMKHIARKYNIKIDFLPFSIGDVYGSKICRLNEKYSEAIINDLTRYIPVDFENRFLNWVTKFYSS